MNPTDCMKHIIKVNYSEIYKPVSKNEQNLYL